jgi:hypothetical protein
MSRTRSTSRRRPAGGEAGADTYAIASSRYATFNVPVIDGWIEQCHPTVCVRFNVMVSVLPGVSFVSELPSSSVNVCSVVSLFVTVSVTFPALTSTESGENAKFCAAMVAVDDAPPPPVDAGGEVAALVVVLVLVADELVLEQAAVTSARATIARAAVLIFLIHPLLLSDPIRRRFYERDGGSVH